MFSKKLRKNSVTSHCSKRFTNIQFLGGTMKKPIIRLVKKFLTETHSLNKKGTESYIRREIEKIPPLHPMIMKAAGWKQSEIDEMDIDARIQCISYVLAGLVQKARKKQKEVSTIHSPPSSHPPS